MIYLLKRSPHNEDFLDGYAVDMDGLCNMAHKYVREYFNYDDPLLVTVMDGSIVVREPNGCEYGFYIVEMVENTDGGCDECASNSDK